MDQLLLAQDALDRVVLLAAPELPHHRPEVPDHLLVRELPVVGRERREFVGGKHGALWKLLVIGSKQK
jgi:hypothetical protein